MSGRASVLVVDDSPFVCRLVAGYLSAEDDLEVTGIAHSGAEALKRLRTLRPDVVTLDLEMPEIDGLEVVRRAMAERPTAVVVITGASGRAATRTLQALDAGAVDFVLKYAPGGEVSPETLRREIVAKVRAAAGVRVVRSLPHRTAYLPAVPPFAAASLPPLGEGAESQGPGRARPSRADSSPTPGRRPTGLVVVGASTGGPLALKQLIAELPADFELAMLVVQHIPSSFTGVLAAQLGRHSRLPVREAETGDRLAAGHVYVAPGGRHLLLRRDGRLDLALGPEVGGHRPSVDVTLQSAVQAFGGRTIGVLLSGMGSDGVEGMRAVRAKGGRTFAQDAASCVVAGMSQRAIEAGLVEAVAPPAALGRLLGEIEGARFASSTAAPEGPIGRLAERG